MGGGGEGGKGKKGKWIVVVSQKKEKLFKKMKS